MARGHQSMLDIERTFAGAIPGIVYADSTSKNWRDIRASAINNAPINNEIQAILDKTSGLILGYRFDGAIKSRYKLGDDPWRYAECHKGQFMVMCSHEASQWSWETMASEGDSLMMMVHLEQTVIHDIVERVTHLDTNLIEFKHVFGQRDFVISDIAKRLYFELVNDDPFSHIKVDLLKQELVVHLLRRYGVFAHKVETNNEGLTKKQLVLIHEYIQTHYSEDIRLKDLADLLYLSEYHFSRQYKKITGMSPYQYILNCRFMKAQELLEFTVLTVQEIAFLTGYKDASTFSKAFRRHFKISPGNYRNQVTR